MWIVWFYSNIVIITSFTMPNAKPTRHMGDYSLKGLATICGGGLTSFKVGINELEKYGYVIRVFIKRVVARY